MTEIVISKILTALALELPEEVYNQAIPLIRMDMARREALIMVLTEALEGVLQQAVILSEDYLSTFDDCPDDHVIQGWDKARWKRAIVAKRAAQQALAKAKEIMG